MDIWATSLPGEEYKNTGNGHPKKNKKQGWVSDAIRRGSRRGERYIDAIQNRRECCLRILARQAKCNEFIACFQEYARDRIHRYDYSIGAGASNDEQNREYYPTTLPGNGYDTYEGRCQTVTAEEAVWSVWILEIPISYPVSNITCEGFDWWVGSPFGYSRKSQCGFFLFYVKYRFAKCPPPFLVDVVCVSATEYGRLYAISAWGVGRRMRRKRIGMIPKGRWSVRVNHLIILTSLRIYP